MENDTRNSLIAAAKEAMERAYAPYSGFSVGAALLLSDGSIVTGVNVENASFGATQCAERTAVGRAIAQGRRDFTAIAVIASTDDIVTPCGICRQVLREFGPKMPVICCNQSGEYVDTTAEELLPRSFGPEYL